MALRSTLSFAAVFVVALFFGLVWAQSTPNTSAAHVTSSPDTTPPTPAMEERFQLLESKIDQLEKENAELSAAHQKTEDQRLDDLAKDISVNYPSAYEKGALNFTVIITDLTIAATLVGLVYAFVTLARTRKIYREDARKEAAAMVAANNHFLTGRFSNNIALVLSEIAWDSENEFELLIPHLATVAVGYQKDSYDAFREESRPELAKDMPYWTLKSLNNLIFMLCNFPSHPESGQIHKYLEELRARKEFEKERILVNTYTYGLLVFCDHLVTRWNVSLEKIYTDVRELLMAQEAKRNEMKISSVVELERIIRCYNSRTGQVPVQEGSTEVQSGAGAPADGSEETLP